MNYNKYSKEQLIEMLKARDKENNINHTSKPCEVFDIVRPYAISKQENFLAVLLDGAYNVIKVVNVSKGLVNKTLAHPREVFGPALIESAVGVVIAHNHPSGNLTPSDDDHNLTNSLIRAGHLIGIPILDHIIFSLTNYFSMKESGEMYFD